MSAEKQCEKWFRFLFYPLFNLSLFGTQITKNHYSWAVLFVVCLIHLTCSLHLIHLVDALHRFFTFMFSLSNSSNSFIWFTFSQDQLNINICLGWKCWLNPLWSQAKIDVLPLFISCLPLLSPRAFSSFFFYHFNSPIFYLPAYPFTSPSSPPT